MTFSYGRGENGARRPWESDKIAKFVKEKVMAEGWALKIKGIFLRGFEPTDMRRSYSAGAANKIRDMSPLQGRGS